MTQGIRKKRILIVDDTRVNTDILVEALKSEYKPGVARSGPEALEYMKRSLPDLLLLDILMPDMDGYEVCARLKSDRRTRDIPVIFITAMDEIEGKTKGFAAGAVDYITRPFDVQEVLARVKIHLTLREQEIQIREYATRLEQMVEERTRQLIHADRLATLGTFAAAIAHEIDNPLTYIRWNTEEVRKFFNLLTPVWDEVRPVVEKRADPKEMKWAVQIAGEIGEMLHNILDGSHSISQLLKNLKSYSRRGDSGKERCRLKDLIYETLYLLKHRLQYGTTVDVSIPPDLEIECNPQRMAQVFVNLLDNSIDAIGNQRGKVSIMATCSDHRVLIQVKDNGPGIPKEVASEVFDPFFTTKGKDKGTGLGLFIVRSIIEEHKGEIVLTARKGEGAEFTISMPAPEFD